MVTYAMYNKKFVKVLDYDENGNVQISYQDWNGEGVIKTWVDREELEVGVIK